MSSRQADKRDEAMPGSHTGGDTDTFRGATTAEEYDDRQRINIIGQYDPTAATFQFDDEDHTLGNALRYIIMKNPEVELCGYSIPHPAEAKMNLRIQTYGSITVYDALEKGLDDLRNLCGVVIEKFEVARNEFNVRQEV